MHARETKPETQPNTKQTQDCLHRYDCPPAVLARAHTGLADKCSALAWSWYMIAGSPAGVLELCSTFACLTSDMGTELGVSEFRSMGVSQLLPDWIPWNVETTVETQGWVFDDDVAGVPASGVNSFVSSSPTDRFLGKSIAIPGLLHIISNLTEEVDKSLIHFKAYSDQLAPLETLLAERGLREMYPDSPPLKTSSNDMQCK